MKEEEYFDRYKDKVKYGWMDGEFVPFPEAKLHVRAISFYGANVFEGIRAYWNEEKQELYIFRLKEHIDRLFNSMKMLRMSIAFSNEDIFNAQVELLSRNEFREDIHSRPTAYFGLGDINTVDPDKVYMGACITAIPSPKASGIETGVHCCISSWQRISDQDMPPRIKMAANYMNGRLGSVQAKADGYDHPIYLNHEGRVTESTGACILMVRDGVVIAPPITANLLESITRATLLKLFREELGVEAVERDVDRTELYIADEVFMCGTGNQVTPVISVDRFPVADGQPGSITRKIQDLFFEIVRGNLPKYRDWLTPVYDR